MADTKKSRSTIRIKSSERKRSASKRESSGNKSKSQPEEEEKESLAWKVLSEEQTQALTDLTAPELEAKLAEVLSIENYHMSLPEACVLDYYVAGFWFSKEQNFSLQQMSAFFTLLKILLENLKGYSDTLEAAIIKFSENNTYTEKSLSLVDNIGEFKNFMTGIGVENCSKSGGLECFNVSQAKLITDYFTDSLFQHYKLYTFLFNQEPEEEIISTELVIEVPPLADLPFPPPLDEGMTEDVWQNHVMTPPQSPEPETEKEEQGTGAVAATTANGDSGDASKDDILTSVKPDEVRTLVKKVADDVLGNFKADVETKLKEREGQFIAKINKQQGR